MYRRRILSAVLASTWTLACGGSPTAPAGAAAVSSLDFPNASASVASTTVDVKSQHLTGTLPNGVAVDVNLKAVAQGNDPSSLTGDGRHFASTGAHSYWPAMGFTDGTNVTLSGTVTESNVSFLIGSPVVVAADASTQAITLSFGPLAGGPFAGQVLVFTGAGKVTITTTP